VADGGLMSYGNNLTDAYRRMPSMSGAFLGATDRVTCQSIGPRSLNSSLIQDRQDAWPRHSATLLARADEVIE